MNPVRGVSFAERRQPVRAGGVRRCPGAGRVDHRARLDAAHRAVRRRDRAARRARPRGRPSAPCRYRCRVTAVTRALSWICGRAGGAQRLKVARDQLAPVGTSSAGGGASRASPAAPPPPDRRSSARARRCAHAPLRMACPAAGPASSTSGVSPRARRCAAAASPTGPAPMIATGRVGHDRGLSVRAIAVRRRRGGQAGTPRPAAAIFGQEADSPFMAAKSAA